MIRILQFLIIFGLGFASGMYFKPSAELPNLSFSHSKESVPTTVPKVDVPSKADVSLYTVQVASFKNEPDAYKLMGDLQNQESLVYIDQNRQGWSRVFVGEYMNKKDAINKLKQLKSDFEEAFVRKLE